MPKPRGQPTKFASPGVKKPSPRKVPPPKASKLGVPSKPGVPTKTIAAVVAPTQLKQPPARKPVGILGAYVAVPLPSTTMTETQASGFGGEWGAAEPSSRGVASSWQPMPKPRGQLTLFGYISLHLLNPGNRRTTTPEITIHKMSKLEHVKLKRLRFRTLSYIIFICLLTFMG